MPIRATVEFSRRHFLRMMGAGSLAAIAQEVFFGGHAGAQARAAGMPLPDERVEATLKRLFGDRPLIRADDKIKVELPPIAEDGGNVPIAIEANLPLDGAPRLTNIYIIGDNNRLPLLAKFSFRAAAGKAFIGTSIRLATTTDVRAVAELSDGTLYVATIHVRVTISGCDLPPGP